MNEQSTIALHVVHGARPCADIAIDPPVAGMRALSTGWDMDVLSVLVADDDAAMATVTARLMREQGYDIRTALSGEQALDDLAERSADVVVLDLEMPGMSGVETLTAIRSDPALAATRVVLYTGYRELPELPDDVRPDAVVTKFEGPRALLATIQGLA